MRSLQRMYYHKDIAAANERLAALYAQRIELENFKKMYGVVQKPLPINQITSTDPNDQKYIQGLQAASNALTLAFYEKYPQDRYHISQVENYIKNEFEPSLQKAAKESYTTVENMPKSWYEQLKEKEAKLSAKEKQKTSQEREKEFKEWQKTTTYKSVEESKNFFEGMKNSQNIAESDLEKATKFDRSNR